MTSRDSDPDEWSSELQLRAFGNRLYTTRALARVTQEELANRTGIGRTHIAAIEKGRINISLETLWRLARGLDVHPASLLDDRDESVPRPGEHRATH
jgi:transcriptional regulator with XRE-family HTH domain